MRAVCLTEEAEEDPLSSRLAATHTAAPASPLNVPSSSIFVNIPIRRLGDAGVRRFARLPPSLLPELEKSLPGDMTPPCFEPPPSRAPFAKKPNEHDSIRTVSDARTATAIISVSRRTRDGSGPPRLVALPPGVLRTNPSARTWSDAPLARRRDVPGPSEDEDGRGKKKEGYERPVVREQSRAFIHQEVPLGAVQEPGREGSRAAAGG